MKFVSSNSASLAKAYVYYDDAIPLAVYNEDLMVGFILLRYYEEQAMELVIEQMKSERKYTKIILCYIDGDEAAKRLYSRLGFYHTGEVDENEIIMRFDF